MQTETVNKAATARESLRPYLWSVASGWLALVVAGIVYARMKQVAAGIAIPIIAAFLIELPLYLAPLFAGTRAAAARLPRLLFATLLAATAVVPYLVYSIPAGCFDGFELYRLAGVAITLSFWYLVLPPRIWSDLLFLAGPTALLILKLLKQIYISPLAHIHMDFLGHLMLIHVSALAILVLRGLTGVQPGIIPTRQETIIGLRAFLCFMPVGLALFWLLRLKMRDTPLPLWYAPGIFVGYYLILAFSEEFAMRGVVQQHLSRLLGRWPGLLIASAVFGLSHINFGTFPNWTMVELASAAGLFYGWAYQQAGSIRASMLTHALTVVVWTLWFR